MAPHTVMIGKEKRDKRAGCPVERFDAADRSRFGVASRWDEFVRQQRCKPFKTGRFPARLRLVCARIYLHHFNRIYESVTYRRLFRRDNVSGTRQAIRPRPMMPSVQNQTGKVASNHQKRRYQDKNKNGRCCQAEDDRDRHWQ